MECKARGLVNGRHPGCLLLFLGGSGTSSSEECHRQIYTLGAQDCYGHVHPIHTSAAVLSSQRKRKGATCGSEQLEDPPLFVEHPPSRGGRKRGDKKRSMDKKVTATLLAESTNMGSYFTDIGLDIEEPMPEGLPPTKKKKVWPEKRMVYKYPHGPKFFASLASTHSVEEKHELLVVGIEFPDLAMLKIEVEHPFLVSTI